MTKLHTGKRPATYDGRDLPLERYATAHEAAALPVPLASFTAAVHRLRAVDWGMLGNDGAGDCVWAGGDHETMAWNLLAGHAASFRPEDALADYAACTGYDPQTGAGDNGTDVRTALGYRRQTGLRDAAGRRHKLAAYLALEPGNHEHVKFALATFDAVGLGFEFPESAMDQFNAGHPWTVVAGAQLDGGHYVPVIGYTRRYLYVVTWGRVQRMSWAFFARYCDEAWALYSEEFLTDGRSPWGIDADQLRADLTGLA